MWAETRRFWRVGVVAILGGLLAFGLSFTADREYESHATLLLHPGDASYVSTGDGESGFTPIPETIDFTTAYMMGQTVKELAESRATAEAIATDLDVASAIEADRAEGGGIVSSISDAIGGVLGFLVYGENNEAPATEQAILDMQDAVRVDVPQQSYVLDTICVGASPEQAQQICDVAADEIVTQSRDRFRQNAENEAAALKLELDRLSADVAAKAQALADYRTAHGLTDGDALIDFTDSDISATKLAEIQVQISVAQAQIASLETQLEGSSAVEQLPGSIRTGRGETEILTPTVNASHEALETQLEQARAELAGLEAQRDALQEILGNLTTADVNNQGIELDRLNSELTIATEAYNAVAIEYEAAVVSQARPAADVTVQSEASMPVNPTRPVRYLYLALGLFVGALAGALLTWVYSHQPLLVPTGDDRNEDADDLDLDLTRAYQPAVAAPDIDLTRRERAKPATVGAREAVRAAEPARATAEPARSAGGRFGAPATRRAATPEVTAAAHRAARDRVAGSDAGAAEPTRSRASRHAAPTASQRIDLTRLREMSLGARANKGPHGDVTQS